MTATHTDTSDFTPQKQQSESVLQEGVWVASATKPSTDTCMSVVVLSGDPDTDTAMSLMTAGSPADRTATAHTATEPQLDSPQQSLYHSSSPL